MTCRDCKAELEPHEERYCQPCYWLRIVAEAMKEPGKKPGKTKITPKMIRGGVGGKFDVRWIENA